MKEQIANKMNELIKINVNDEGKQLVSARELHEFLKVKEDFTHWIKRQLESVDAIENEDFMMHVFKHERQFIHEYEITLEIAKEICMICGVAPRVNYETKKLSKQARQYFIACEKKLKENNKPKKLSAIDQLKLQNEAILEVNQKVDKLEADMPLFKAECDELQALVKKTGTKLLGGKDAAAYKDKSTRTKVYTDIQHQLKREFGVNKYSWIKHSQFNRAKEIIEGYKLPICLEDSIEEINRQLSFN